MKEIRWQQHFENFELPYIKYSLDKEAPNPYFVYVLSPHEVSNLNLLQHISDYGIEIYNSLGD